MATRYSRNTNMDDDNIVEGRMAGGYREEPELDEPDEEVLEPVTKLVRKMLREREKANQQLERKLQKIVNRRNPTGSSLKPRQGWLGKNKKDLARVDTDRANEDLAVLIAKAVANTGKLASYGHEIATSATEYMYSQDDELPEELQPYGRAISKVLSELLAETVVEGATMYPEISFKEIAKLHRE
jgi:hypothetical protein